MSEQKKILVVSFQSLTQNSAGGMARLGYYLSKQLHERGLLKNFIVYSKGKFDTDFPSMPVSKYSRYILYILNKLNKLFNWPEHYFRLLQENLFDVLCKQHIDADIAVLFTTNAHMKRTFSKAKKLGIPIVFVPANPEEHFIDKIVTEENKKLDIDSVDAYTYEPRIKLYDEAIKHVDTVIGTYPTVYQTYANANGNYKLVQINGHLKPDFNHYKYAPVHLDGTYKVVYVATTIALKGLQYLLEAWQQTEEEHPNLDIQLHIVGNIHEDVQKYIGSKYNKLTDVTFAGRVPDVGEYIKDKHISIVPSLTDGGPYTALEAAHYGLPVIITENCGSAELLSRNNGCIVIPIRDAQKIKEQILWAYHNREDARQMGIRAKEVLDKYEQEDFILQITNYLKTQIK